MLVYYHKHTLALFIHSTYTACRGEHSPEHRVCINPKPKVVSQQICSRAAAHQCRRTATQFVRIVFVRFIDDNDRPHRKRLSEAFGGLEKTENIMFTCRVFKLPQREDLSVSRVCSARRESDVPHPVFLRVCFADLIAEGDDACLLVCGCLSGTFCDRLCAFSSSLKVIFHWS